MTKHAYIARRRSGKREIGVYEVNKVDDREGIEKKIKDMLNDKDGWDRVVYVRLQA